MENDTGLLLKIDECNRVHIPPPLWKRVRLSGGTRLFGFPREGGILIPPTAPPCLLCGSSRDLLLLDDDTPICQECVGRIKRDL